MGGFSHIGLGVAVARSMHFRSRVNATELNALYPAAIIGLRSTKHSNSGISETCFRSAGVMGGLCRNSMETSLFQKVGVLLSVKEFIILYLFNDAVSISVYYCRMIELSDELECGME